MVITMPVWKPVLNWVPPRCIQDCFNGRRLYDPDFCPYQRLRAVLVLSVVNLNERNHSWDRL